MRLAPVSEQVRPKESAIGAPADVSQMTKREAIEHFTQRLDSGQLTHREALAIQLVDRMVADPHTVDDSFFAQLKEVFSDEELVELVFATALFIWGNHFNITMRVDADPASPWPKDLPYASATWE